MQAVVLADLKVGDQVAIPSGYARDDYTLLTIVSISNRGIITLQNGNRYRSDGTPMDRGGKWHRPFSIEAVTDEVRKVIRKNNLVSAINGLNYNDWQAMSLVSLEHIYAQIKLAQAEIGK